MTRLKETEPDMAHKDRYHITPFPAFNRFTTLRVMTDSNSPLPIGRPRRRTPRSPKMFTTVHSPSCIHSIPSFSVPRPFILLRCAIMASSCCRFVYPSGCCHTFFFPFAFLLYIYIQYVVCDHSVQMFLYTRVLYLMKVTK